MRASTSKLLCCPECGGVLSLGGAPNSDIVDDGELVCPRCVRIFPIKDGIGSFISLEELTGLNRRFALFYERFSGLEALLEKLSFLFAGGERKVRGEVLKRLEPDAKRVLEVSIGSGGNLPYLFEAGNVFEVCGVDISTAQLKRCSKLVRMREWPVDLFCGMAEALPFKTESFDSVLHLGGINFFSNKQRAIEEMIRVARPGSNIVVADESERVARFVARMFRLSRVTGEDRVDTSTPTRLVPETMEDIREEGIWKRHGHYHGYCLEFRKPAR